MNVRHRYFVWRYIQYNDWKSTSGIQIKYLFNISETLINKWIKTLIFSCFYTETTKRFGLHKTTGVILVINIKTESPKNYDFSLF